jgi:hypothetical protein
MQFTKLKSDLLFKGACHRPNTAFIGTPEGASDSIDKREFFYTSILQKLGLLLPSVSMVYLGPGF